MRQAQFNIAIQGVPTYYAVFRVIQIPAWLKGQREILEVGDLMYWNNRRGTMVKVSNSHSMSIGPSYLNFVFYMTATEMQKANE